MTILRIHWTDTDRVTNSAYDSREEALAIIPYLLGTASIPTKTHSKDDPTAANP